MYLYISKLNNMTVQFEYNLNGETLQCTATIERGERGTRGSFGEPIEPDTEDDATITAVELDGEDYTDVITREELRDMEARALEVFHDMQADEYDGCKREYEDAAYYL